MFSVVFHGGGKRYTTDLPLPAQYRLVGTVVIGDDLVGRIGAEFPYGYNPFDLYGAARIGRNAPLSPHLVFAGLEQNADDACAFLNAYGPLEGLAAVSPPPRKAELKKWEMASAKSPSPEDFFLPTLGKAPLLPPPANPQDEFYRYPIKDFWREQSDFELALRLHGALSSSPSELYSNIRRVLRIVDADWAFRDGSISGVGLDELPPLRQDIELRYINAASHFVRNTVNSHLELAIPRVVPYMGSVALGGIWGCYSLLQAMYLMFFLDVASRHARIVQCEKCGALFYSDLKRGTYCSDKCQNRARALRAYHKKKGGS